MSDILGQIDDTLDNWHGSRDAMHWTPDEVRDHDASRMAGYFGAMQDIVFSGPATLLTGSGERLDVTAVRLTLADRPATEERLAALAPVAFSFDMTFPLIEPVPDEDYWAAQAMRRTICAAFDVPPRAIGFAPRYGLDARYQQRQRNRRKRR